MDRTERQALVELLLRHLAAAAIPAELILPALRALAPKDDGAPVPAAELLRALDAAALPELDPLRSHLRQPQPEAVRLAHERKKTGLPIDADLRSALGDLPVDVPVGWRSAEAEPAALERVLSLGRDRLFATGDPFIKRAVDEAMAKALAALPRGLSALIAPLTLVAEARSIVGPGRTQSLLTRIEERVKRRNQNERRVADEALDRLPEPLAGDLDPAILAAALTDRLGSTQALDARRRLLDAALAWPSDGAAAVLPTLCSEPWAQERASNVLALRFGGPRPWPEWLKWLMAARERVQTARDKVQSLAKARPVEMLLLWELREAMPEPELVAGLETWCVSRFPPIPREVLAQRWGAPSPPPAVVASAAMTPEPAAPRAQAPVVPRAVPAPRRPAPPPGPSLWRDYIQSFLVENWYLVVGLLMVVAGSSLLAYFTWDKHWLIRYTIMPGLLGAFTAGLAGIASWIERQNARFKGTGALLRGTAIGLLPVNFMAVALLSQDPLVAPAQKLAVVPLMAALYLVLFGWGLASWCQSVHPSLGRTLGGTLLALNALVILGPVAQAVVRARGSALHLVLGLGFYLGFLALTIAVHHFSEHVLSAELARERRVPWFVGATLVVTYLQVFGWVHAFLRYLPQTHTYAALVVLAGSLVLSTERRFLDLRGESGRHVGESFLGFAFVLTGILLGLGQPDIRILVLALAGLVWLRQAEKRGDARHHAIGLVLLCLAVASVGLLHAFPQRWLPVLGIGLAGGLSGLESWTRRRARHALLGEAATALQQVVLFLTAGVAVLTQWHFRSEPLATAAFLLVVATFFAWHAERLRNLRALLTTAVVLAATLPYTGCVDVLGRNLHGNTMAFGLAILAALWLALTLRTRDDLLLSARSTVLWFYGSLALAALVLRVLAEGPTPGDQVSFRAWMDYGGPLAMTAILLITAYLSRSMIPSWMAAVLSVVLFPELRAHLQIAFPGLSWGSGLGSALAALGLTLLSFRLRSWPFLAKLEGGDRFLGREPFPWRCADATLYTAPAILSAVFLSAKVGTWNVSQNLQPGTILGLKTTAALGIISITWTVLAVFLRERSVAVTATHLGWFTALLTIGFALDHVPGRPGAQWTFFTTGVLLQALELAYSRATAGHQWVERVLLAPTRGVLQWGTLALAGGTLVALWGGEPLSSVWALLVFLAVELVARGLSTGRLLYGASLFLLGWTALLARTAPGAGPLMDRIGVETSLAPTLWLCVAIQLLHVLLETRPAEALRLRPLLWPLQLGATVVAAGLGCLGMADALSARAAAAPDLGLLLAVVLLTGRAHGSGFFALVGAFLGYLVAENKLLDATPSFENRLDLLLMPWRAGALAFAIAVAASAGRALFARRPRFLVGSLGFPELRWPATPWLFGPAVILALGGAFRQTVDPALREAPLELWASYLGSATLLLIGWSWGQGVLYGLGGMLLALGNVHAVRVFIGVPLRDRGLSEDHLVALGLGATLLQGSALRVSARRESLSAAINAASLPLATLILALLCTNYLIHPNIETIPPLRFAISGAMAFLAGLYFRRASLKPGPGEEPYVDVCASLYHFGVTLAIWCVALLVPWLRQPRTALLALGIPVFYFYARAEAAYRAGDDVTLRRHRSSAATLGFVLLALYVFRAAFQMALFPETAIHTEHYHDNAPYLMLLALVLLRLHGLGATVWVAFYGGLALVVGNYFTLTALPGLSPFERPAPAAWCGLALAHFWTVATYQTSPLSQAVQAMAAIDVPLWTTLRRWWGYCALAATHLLVLVAILDPSTDSHLIAPLLFGAASILVHQGIQRESGVYSALAAVECVLALHTGFVDPSYLGADDVVWALLGLWALFLVTQGFLERWLTLRHPGTVATLFAALCLAHVLYHHPSSTTGLWAFALTAALGLLSPFPTTQVATAEASFLALLPLVTPAWLVFFSQAKLLEDGPSGAIRVWPLLATAATVLLTGAASAWYQERGTAARGAGTSRPMRLFDATSTLLLRRGGDVRALSACVSFVVALAILVGHYDRPYAPRELQLFMALFAGLAWTWFQEGRARRSTTGYAMAQISVFALFALVRRQLTLTTAFWTPEDDVWLSLLVSLGMTGAKPWIDRQPREARLPSMVSLFALPVVAIVWTLANDLGSDTALLVIGLHSVMFAFLGREERDSPYNLLAVSGFVTFIVIVFWSKLELRVLHAYVIPVAIGVLVLVQLFGGTMDPGTRNRVRAVAVLAMLGTAGYSALADDRYPLAFHVTLLLLCLAGMGLGSLLRIRLYLALGSTGVAVDLASLVLKALVHMDRGPRMTAVGTLVLLLGVTLVAGAVYYKTHGDVFNERVDGWRRRLGAWE